jgi:hypothetical protein
VREHSALPRASPVPRSQVPNAIAFVIAIDWLMDRFRTACNVNGDAFVSGMVDAIAKRSEASSAISDSISDSAKLEESMRSREPQLCLRSLADVKSVREQGPASSKPRTVSVRNTASMRHRLTGSTLASDVELERNSIGVSAAATP